MKKNWKDYINLFNTHKFKLYIWGEPREFSVDEEGDLIYFETPNEYNRDGILYPNDDYCKLIGRSIHDMTDEEWMNMKGLPTFNKNQIERRKNWFDVQVLTAEDLLYLLDIGVVPPQFWDDNTVMNIKDVE